MTYRLSRYCQFAGWALVSQFIAFCAYAFPVDVVDIAGRQVHIKAAPQRIVMGEARHIYALAVLEKNPFKRIVAWANDFRNNDTDAYNRYVEKFPEVEKITDLGAASAPLNFEKILAMKADLVLLDLGAQVQLRESGLLEKLDKVGIPAVFIDFRENPTEHATPSIRLLGRILDLNSAADAFNDFATEQIRIVSDTLKDVPQDKKPLVFVERDLGWDPNAPCCETYGPFNYGKYTELAGGINWGSKYYSGTFVVASPERVFKDNPDFYVMTSSNWGTYKPDSVGVPLGYDAKEDVIQEKMKNLLARPGFSELKAVKNKNALAIFHQFYDSPYYFIAIQALAKAFHPDLFTRLDPVETFRELHRKFLPFPFSGIFWARLK